jgi:NTP pyrophosphatase (non-canonical NTP hydrolase)
MNEKQKEVMLIAQEECAEVIQAISKVFRFGRSDEYNGQSNKQRLEEEVGDLLCMIRLMMNQGMIDENNVNKASVQKQIKLERWSNIFTSEVGEYNA